MRRGPIRSCGKHLCARAVAALSAVALVVLAVGPRAARAQEPATPEPAAARVAGAFKAPHVPGEVIVKMREGASKRADQVVEAVGLQLVERSSARPDLTLVRAASDEHAVAAAVALSADESVEYAEPNYLLTKQSAPNDPRFGAQWGLQSSAGVDVAAVQAWERTVGSDDVVVGVIDSGMDIKHEDLRPNLYVNPGEVANNGVDDDGNGYVDDVNGWDAVTNSGKMKDDDGHGTHVSGIVGARGNNGIGISGVMWRARLLPLRFITINSGSTFDAIECIDYAVKLRTSGVNLRVLNNSWGGGGFSNALRAAIERANRAGILFVCAAGNESSDGDVVTHYPSAYDIPNVVSVGAITKANSIASFSNYGRRSVDIFAPGEAIVSTVPGDGYESFNGTSQASPFVAGIAGLIVAEHPDATVAELKARLLGSAVSENYAATRCLTGGRVNASNALRSETSAPGALVDFRLRTVTRSTVAVEWTSVGDDGASGQATYYDIRWSTSPIDDSTFDAATQISDTRVPLRAGQTESATIRGCFDEGQAIFLAMRVYDKAGNFAQSDAVTAEPTGELPTYEVVSAAGLPDEIGTPLGLEDDDAVAAVELPFDFPFAGANYRTAYVSTNGIVSFDGPVAAPVGSLNELRALTAIAPLWIDLRTDGKLSPNEDVYVLDRGDSVTVRWIAELFFAPGGEPRDAQPISFAVTLHADGAVDLDYGPGGNRYLRTGGYSALVGISDGGCAATLVDGYSGADSFSSAAAVRLKPNDASRDDAPSLTTSTIAGAVEGTPLEFTVSATTPSGGQAELGAALPRNATFDPATGAVRFTPDSTQSGNVLFLFTATSASGVTSTRTIKLFVLNNSALPDVQYVAAKKKKVTFYGGGFRPGSQLEIDGSVVGDAKNNKKSPSTRLVSSSAGSMLGGPSMHVVSVVNPDGARSGPYYYWQ